MQFFVFFLIIFYFSLESHAASITNGSISASNTGASVLLSGPNVSAPGIPDLGTFLASPLLAHPGDTVNVFIAFFTPTFAVVDGESSTTFFPFHPDSNIQAFANIAATIPNDATGLSLSISGPGSLNGTLSFNGPTLHEGIGFDLTGTGTVNLLGSICPSGVGICYQATSASLVGAATPTVPEPSSYLLLLSGLIGILTLHSIRKLVSACMAAL
jgi:hypothetical protein